MLYIFFQRGCCAPPTDSELQRQETPSHTHIYCCNSLHCRFLAGRLLSTPTDSELQRQETPSHTHIYCCNSIHYRFLAGRLLSTPTDSELQRQETSQPHTHILVQQPTLYIFFSEAVVHHPQILNYKGRKHPATHTYTTATTYTIDFHRF